VGVEAVQSVRALAAYGLDSVGALHSALQAVEQDSEDALQGFSVLIGHAREVERALPQGWLDAAAAGVLHLQVGTPRPQWLPAAELAMAWVVSAGGSHRRLWQLPVREATAAQLGSQQAACAVRLGTYAALAADDTREGEMADLFARAWALPCDNAYKEILWTLANNTLATADRLGRGCLPCCCGEVTPSRLHLFWECPVARAVAAEMQRVLPSSAPALERAHVWLGRPLSGIPPAPWLIGCLAMLTACARTRAMALRRMLSRGLDGPVAFLAGPLPFSGRCWPGFVRLIWLQCRGGARHVLSSLGRLL
jgi:hypothetical protein